MNTTRTLPLIACTLLLGACAGKPSKSTPPPAASAAPQAASASADSSAAPTAAEDDYAALYGNGATGSDPTSSSYDPWERYNRGMHRFNVAVDRSIAKPVATGYTKVLPSPVRQSVTNFFANLGSPLTMVNQLLQGHPGDAWDTFGRFLMNTTLGIGGLFDPASKAQISNKKEDFGQTLATWGWRNSRYFELPFFGPRTLRDTFGLVGDYPLSPLRQVENDKVRIGLQGVQLVDTRARLLSLEDIRTEAQDEYALVRDAWMQRRNYQIQRDLRGHQDDAQLPDYLRDDKDNTVPVDAMPMPTLSN
jgi:phospholipid-binding lipoprotein MlaA